MIWISRKVGNLLPNELGGLMRYKLPQIDFSVDFMGLVLLSRRSNMIVKRTLTLKLVTINDHKTRMIMS